MLRNNHSQNSIRQILGTDNMVEIITYIGQRTITSLAAFCEFFAFSQQVIIRMLSRNTYNSATKMVQINQIYFTSLQILPLFLFISVIFGSLLVGIVFQAIKSFGLAEYLGDSHGFCGHRAVSFHHRGLNHTAVIFGDQYGNRGDEV